MQETKTSVNVNVTKWRSFRFLNSPKIANFTDVNKIKILHKSNQ